MDRTLIRAAVSPQDIVPNLLTYTVSELVKMPRFHALFALGKPPAKSSTMHRIAPLPRKTCIGAFTLMEGLIGIAVMGTVFLALYAGMATGFASIRATEENLRATQIMTEKFEAMRLYNWEQINTAGFVPDTFTAYYSPKSSNRGTPYAGTIKFSNLVPPEVYSGDFRTVTITVTWKSGKRTNTRTLSSFVARYGLQNYVY